MSKNPMTVDPIGCIRTLELGRQVAGDYCVSAVDRVTLHDLVATTALAFFRDALGVQTERR